MFFLISNYYHENSGSLEGRRFPPKSNQPNPTVSPTVFPEPGTAMERLRKRCRWFFFVSPQADLRFGTHGPNDSTPEDFDTAIF